MLVLYQRGAIICSTKKSMTKEFHSTLVKHKGKGISAVMQFEFDDAGGEGVAIPTKIHLIPIGQWEHDLYGPMIINASDIREFQQNFNADVRKGVFITCGHEGFMELPAAGWVKEVESRDDGLWGTIEWNELGKETLKDKQFKFFSPEMYRDYEDPQSHQFYRNVLTGGALTKSPYFKELEAVVFSDKNIKSKHKEEKIMTKTLEEILKVEDVSTLNAEEKALLKENEGTLNDEQKAKFKPALEVAPTETEAEKTAREEKEKGDENEKNGLNRDGSVKVQASEKAGMVMIEASALKILEAKANSGADAAKKLEASELDQSVGGMVFSETNKEGKFLPKSKDSLRAFMEGLNVDQRKKFSEIVKDLPTTQIFKEVGAGSKTAVAGSVREQVETKIKEKMSTNAKLKYSDALKEVFAEDAELSKKYDAELQQD